MKTKALILVLLMLAGYARADAWDDALTGGLLGAGAGLLVSELSDDYDASYTVPLFTGIGALTGYAIHQDSHSSHGYHHAYYLPYLALPYAWYSHRYPRRYYDYRGIPPARRRSQGGTTKTAPPTSSGRHPGVTLTSVPIALKNGTVVPISILRLGDRFIGPQGESYATMPDAKTLQLRYAP